MEKLTMPVNNVYDLSRGPSAAATNLTNNQFLMWLGQKLNPDVPLYNMIQTFEIQGRVSPHIFAQAFACLVQESDALRTVVEEQNGVPYSVVLDEIPQPLEYLDFSSEADPDGSYKSWLEARRARLFNLAERLFDSCLIKLGEARYMWYLNQHHLITDGWSCWLVYRRTAEWYTALLREEPHLTPPLPSYAAYAAYERVNRSSEAYLQAERFWNDRLQDPSDPVTYYSGAKVEKSSRTERVVCELGPDRSARLREMLGRPGLQSFSLDYSIFNAFATVFCAFLHRLSGAQRIALGTPFHNRAAPDFKATIGLFIEVCPLVVQVQEEDTFLSLYKRIAREAFQALQNIQPGISSAERNRSYQNLLNYVNVTFPKFCDLPVRVDWVHPGYGDSSHSLRLQIHDFNGTGSYVLHFDFNVGVFSEPQREWAIEQFLRVFDSFVTDPARPINTVRLTSGREEQKYLHDFNRSEADYPVDRTVIALFEQQVESTPDDVAAVFYERKLTYRELNRLANGLAHRLQALGAGPEMLVGICMEHSLEMLVGLLGILKSGAAYVPLDPAYPKERLARMLQDMGAGRSAGQLLVTQPWLVERLPDVPLEPVLLDSSWDGIAGQPEENPPSAAGPGNLAYVIFTSGSTGTPKGAMIEHRGLVNYLWWAKRAYYQGERLDFALFSSLSFDLTVTSIFLPLISGGRAVIYREEAGARGTAVLNVFQDADRVDIVKLTPAHLTLIKDMDLRGKRVRKLIVGGEDFKTDLARRIRTAFGGEVEIYNEYGPTETVVGCMIHRFDPERDRALSVPIGVPAANAQIYVLDKFLNPVPTGVVGEMYIGGDGVGRGYLNRPELTAQKFLHDPFRPGGRLYRTGDLARWEPEGRLTFLGRADDQVKINGFRIELGEVEARLRQFPGIRDCVVEVAALSRRTGREDITYCTRCGLASNYPGVRFDEDGVCSLCLAYDSYKERAQAYFKPMEALRELFRSAPRGAGSEYDCLVLLSGGKDSTYMLYQIVGMGLKPLTYTLDNGFISEGAKANIRSVTEALQVDHVYGRTPAMDAIFVDSLMKHSNVCNGCFKTLYTLAVQEARQRGIRYIVTGLSRGQFFETRLTPELFRNPNLDPDSIDQAILGARKAYHRQEDLISRSLEVDFFRQDAVFEDIQFVDFYRYCDVGLDEMYAFLQEKAPWIRPGDTGRSTNCLINDAGIYLHKKQRGFHNYALPYSWDVRLGHKQRQAALDELQDEIDEGRVREILDRIGYIDMEQGEETPVQRLVAYYVSDRPLPVEAIRSHLAQALPDYMLPAFMIHLEKIPLTPNGKVDRRALPQPENGRPELAEAFIAPQNPIQEQLAEIWAEVLKLDRVGIQDNFFALGGSSLPALQVISRVIQAFQVNLPAQLFFDHPTIEGLSQAIEDLLLAEIEALSEEEAALQMKGSG